MSMTGAGDTQASVQLPKIPTQRLGTGPANVTKIKRSHGNSDAFRKYTARTMIDQNSRQTRNLSHSKTTP